MHGDLKAVAYLLKKSKSAGLLHQLVHQKDRYGWQAIHLAAHMGHGAVVEKLAAQDRAVLCATSLHGVTVAQTAEDGGHHNIAAFVRGKLSAASDNLPSPMPTFPFEFEGPPTPTSGTAAAAAGSGVDAGSDTVGFQDVVDQIGLVLGSAFFHTLPAEDDSGGEVSRIQRAMAPLAQTGLVDAPRVQAALHDMDARTQEMVEQGAVFRAAGLDLGAALKAMADAGGG